MRSARCPRRTSRAPAPGSREARRVTRRRGGVSTWAPRSRSGYAAPTFGRRLGPVHGAEGPSARDARARGEEEAVGGQREDGRQVSVVLVVRAREARLGVRDRIENEREDRAIPRRHIRGRAVNETVAEDERR